MIDDDFYHPGDPEYNSNDPMKPRTIAQEQGIETLKHVQSMFPRDHRPKEFQVDVTQTVNSAKFTQSLETAVQSMQRAVAGIRSQMENLSTGLKEVLPHVADHDPTPMFEMHEVFPESDLQVIKNMAELKVPSVTGMFGPPVDPNPDFPELKVQGYMIDVNLPADDVTKESSSDEIDPLSDEYVERMKELAQTLAEMRVTRAKALRTAISRADTESFRLRDLLKKLEV